jgi:hypothetical protein
MTVKNVGASIRQRLLNKAKSDKRPFQELLQYYAMERFLYRLSLSEEKNAFILKGALMLRVWESPQCRPTMDIDFLGRTSNEISNVIARIKTILSVPVESDGLNYSVNSIQAEAITEEADYNGVRIKFIAHLDTARVNLQLDIGFGDIVSPKAEWCPFPSILDLESPLVLCYSKESAIAEKYHAIVKLGFFNSRMKDFYDIWLLSRQFSFNRETLKQAITCTFAERKTELPKSIIAFSDEFCEAKQSQWAAFRNRLGQEFVPISLKDIVTELRAFLL